MEVADPVSNKAIFNYFSLFLLKFEDFSFHSIFCNDSINKTAYPVLYDVLCLLPDPLLQDSTKDPLGIHDQPE